jgi:hypothetical protein
LFVTKNALSLAALALAALALPPGASAAPASFCASDFSSCSIFEDGLVLQLPGLAISGDVVLIDRFTGATSDVFRIFNDFFDSGGGTGFGDFSFLYSAMFNNLPDPSTYSVNAVTVPLGPDQGNGFNETVYIGAFGTEFDIFTAVPEPSTLASLATAGLALACAKRAVPTGLRRR